jgi:hypothetical protein
MAQPTELESLESANACYYYIYHYVKDYNAKQLENDDKTMFAVTYLLEQFFWCISKLLTDDFRKLNPEMSDAIWLQVAATGSIGCSFSFEEIPIIVYDDLDLVEFYPIFRRIYSRNRRRLNGGANSLQAPDKKEDDLTLDTSYKYPIHSRSSIWIVKRR